MPHAALALLVSVLLAVLPAALPAPAQEARAAQVFADGQAQVVPAFEDKDQWIQHDLWVETEFDSDGDGKKDRMHVDVTRPGQTASEGLKVHVIYETSPYFSGTAGDDRSIFWDPRQELGGEPKPRPHPPEIEHQSKRPLMSKSLLKTWLPRGFAVVHSASPGTGLSQGCPTVGGANEALAPKAVIDWLNGRAKGYSEIDGDVEVTADWSTGRVGMLGTSYNGTLPLAAATTGVEGLMAIAPDAPNTSYYHYYRSNGLVRHPGGYMGEDVDVLYDFIHSGWPERRGWCNENVRDKELAAGADRVSGDLNDFWEGRDYVGQLDGVRAAVLLSHGLNDWNVMPEHSLRVYERLRALGVPSQLYLHQGGHGGPPPLEQQNRWFTRWVCGIENGVENDPRAWVVREGAKRDAATPYLDWPNPDAVMVELFPGKGGSKVGTLGLEASKSLRESLTDDASVPAAELAMSESSQHRLLYATPELQAPLHLSGTVRLRLRLASDRPAANLSVWLVALPWEEKGRVSRNIVTRGWADPQNALSERETQPLEKDRFVDLAFGLQPDDQILPEGARLGLMVFSSDHDFTLWPEPGTELTLDLAGCALELPVVGGEPALRAALGVR
ncbi:MAG TPA: Xaa-Pro dipeptidyl-peptidase [Planctomycetota bacterium]|nr:Xaa-Pro dipeptidyl-peptidase [Planctomycetota bacterium]